jgi:mannose-6-phosphate isomerase-like protein (cupin superfamily)
MRLPTCVLLSLLSAAPAVTAQTQTTKPPAPAPPRRAASPTAITTTVSISVTDGKGAPIPYVAIRASGPVDREATTDGSGSLRLEGLQSGSYRFRYVHDGFVTLERDLTVPAGQRAMDQRVMLSAAEKPPEPDPPAVKAPPPAPQPPSAPPPGKPATVSVPDFIERNFITNSQPQKVTPVACSGVAQTVLWQIREPWTNRQHADTEAMLYVVGGEGTLALGGRDVPLSAGTFASVPRGTSYGLTRRGRNPLIILANLAGEGCTPDMK